MSNEVYSMKVWKPIVEKDDTYECALISSMSRDGGMFIYIFIYWTFLSTIILFFYYSTNHLCP